MIARIKNPLLFGSWVFLIAYWGIGPFIPDPFISLIASFVTMVAAAINAAKYAPDTYRVLVKKERDEGPYGGGSHIALYGVFLLSVGSFYSGAFGTLWITIGQPEGWTATFFSAFGRVLTGVGFIMMSRAAPMARDEQGSISYWWALIMGSVMLLLAFFAGNRFSLLAPIPTEDIGIVRRLDDDRPICPRDRPVWVSQTGVYHTAESAYRSMIRPVNCFATDADARAKGFRPPRG